MTKQKLTEEEVKFFIKIVDIIDEENNEPNRATDKFDLYYREWAYGSLEKNEKNYDDFIDYWISKNGDSSTLRAWEAIVKLSLHQRMREAETRN